MKPYRSSHKVTVGGVLLLAAAAILGGALIGVLGSLIAQIYYLIFVFAVAMAVAGTWLLRRVIDFAQVRNVLIAGSFGLLMGLTIYTAYQYADYYAFRSEVTAILGEEYQLDQASAAQAFQDWIVWSTGRPGFLGFMTLRAEGGETFSNYLMVNYLVLKYPEFTLRSGWAWLHWTIEALLVALVTTSMASAFAGRPFCENGPGWYDDFLTGVGRVECAQADEFLAALQAGDYSRAARLLQPEEQVEHPTLEVYAQHCARHPGADVLLTLKRTALKPNGAIKRTEVLRGEVPADAYAVLTRGLEPEAAG